LLSRSLQAVVSAIDHGERSTGFLRSAAHTILSRRPEARLEYFEITDPETLAPVERITGPVLIAAAMWLGSTRLIDNMSWPDRNDGTCGLSFSRILPPPDECG
jgi:pantoate--beta-alanine ligase